MRLFISVNLSEEMKHELVCMQKRMKMLGVKGNYTRRENLHLTVAFIGEFKDPDEVIDILESVHFDPFRIRLQGIGAFRNLWWAGISRSREMEALAGKIRRALSEGGIPFDRKKFSAHVTLVRKPESRNGRIPEEILEMKHAAEMTVEHVSLMRSDRGRHSVIYTELYP